MARRDTSIAISRVRYDQLRKVARRMGMSPREAIESWIVEGLKELGCDATGVPYWAPPPVEVRRVEVDEKEFIELQAKGWPLTLLRISIKEPDLPPRSETDDFCDALFAAAEYNEPWEYDCTKHGGRFISIRRQGGATALAIKDISEHDEELVEQERESEDSSVLLTPPLLRDLADAIRYLALHPETTVARLTKISLEESQKADAGCMLDALEEAYGDQ